MTIQQEIAEQVAHLPPSAQEQVLRFVTSLTPAEPVGEKGSALRKFSTDLDSESAQEMKEAIEKECEQVETTQW